ncbi:MAG: hypothetical protein AAFY88_01365 [Acidobacteriota bacterium]
MESLGMVKKQGVGRWRWLTAGLAVALLTTAAWAQDGDAEPAEPPTGTVVTLGVGVLDQALQAYEIGSVPDGPPTGKPTFIDVGSTSVGLSVGLLDAEQKVVEVQVFRGADEEPLVALLIEPDVTGYVDLDDGTSLVVALQGIERRGSRR